MRPRSILLLLVLVLCLTSTDCGLVQAKKKNKGSVRYTNRTPRKPKIYEHPKWIDEAALFVDSIWDWFGYHEIPHLMRYASVLFVLGAPFYACFFVYCCVHNDEYDDPEEEAALKHRAAVAHERKLRRLEKAR